MRKELARLLFVVLITVYLGYTAHLYLKPEPEFTSIDHQKAAQGRLVWQRHNCQSCHQLYGLGGYLGPDLTHLYAQPAKGKEYIRAFILSGTAQMPAFRLHDTDLSNLMEFLRLIDTSGISDPRQFHIQADGMIRPK